ncbi:MAG: hypothetical protein COT46_09620 [Sulfurimonas sp. CG08_land_8_20_14_0_20_36_33]|nr:MAG: hypothetical protein AUJ81_05040 [Helicobacteraceae bacterium CG1_02_36_14]PIP09345.1 MAG: hypothetical protein COX50_11645 [Sulfurimonas sp. CG23_combo_of_CG06-09_8_20_14_all_36_33]PIS24398.1 MAG: hypothetical protein COT46_09620 [Sulfurimonas sp. CG08_land_8_20_14_0_20_36_33]PIU33751.1 MAG: hypothetical protein COT05_10865 [Sulfurimonas sp. CG07_land_8_20_14_0_80_36_56]PIV03114.1 MAG: hypothetical protein COS56_09875 [Sulfurimonas sp. CG03_land_8_20_14_0_80_36_25]PIV34977.1 MAG: hypo
MKKIVLSTIAAIAVGVTSLSAGQQFYVNEDGQVFTTSATDRIAIDQKETDVFSHADKLKFNGLAYLGLTSTDYRAAESSKADTSKFELRRAYFQLKAYLLEDKKSYYRVTMDATNVAGYQTVILKYAYLYLNNVLPFTGVELGQVHRPWIDYEEHNSWGYRDIQKVFVEEKNTAHLTNSADLGFNFKTKTKYFDSEIGMFQGEGYHTAEANNDGMSLEWRATAHLLGVNGKDKFTKKTYADVSFYGQYNTRHTADTAAKSGYSDLVFGGLHAVFNTPAFQIAGQYILSTDTSDVTGEVSKQAGSGYNAHTIARFGSDHQYAVLGRYDSWTANKFIDADEVENRTYTLGASWQQNENVQWVANVTTTDNQNNSSLNANMYMLTAQVEF